VVLGAFSGVSPPRLITGVFSIRNISSYSAMTQFWCSFFYANGFFDLPSPVGDTRIPVSTGPFLSIFSDGTVLSSLTEPRHCSFKFLVPPGNCIVPSLLNANDGFSIFHSCFSFTLHQPPALRRPGSPMRDRYFRSLPRRML